jgi:Amino acid permease.
MDQQLTKKYGLLTAIAMVVGIVIGSGVFFKAEKVLTATGGDLPLGILAWIIGGVIMISCAYTFAVMATRYEYVNGIVDYAEATMGKSYGFYVGWFMTMIYYPTLTSVLAWVSARYTAVLFGWDITGGQCM